jgi:RNA polymerase sigma-70 factor, ECF subfamily
METGMHSRHADRSEPSSVSSTLLARIKAHQPEAWRRFVDIYGPVIYRWCRMASVPKDEAADVVQEVFIAATKHIDEFRRDRPGDSLTGWMSAITRSKVVDYFRSRQGRAAGQGGTDAYERLCQFADSSSISLIKEPEESQALIARLGLNLVRAEFEDHTWQAFWRTAVEGQPANVVAADLRMTVQAVYKAKSRVLRRARQELKGLLD